MSTIEVIGLDRERVPKAPWYKNRYCLMLLCSFAFDIEDEVKQYNLRSLAADYHATQKDMRKALEMLEGNGDITIEYVKGKRNQLIIGFCSKLVKRWHTDT